MFDFGCHRIEVLLNLLGPIGRVSGMTARVALEREVEDTAAALFHSRAAHAPPWPLRKPRPNLGTRWKSSARTARSTCRY